MEQSSLESSNLPISPVVKLNAFKYLLMDDSYAATFQTLGQYRQALLKELEKLCAR